MRRVRLEKLREKRNWPARYSQHRGTCQPFKGLSSEPRSRPGETPSAFRFESGCVRSSNGENCRLFRNVLRCVAGSASYRRRMQTSAANARPRARIGVSFTSDFLEAIAYAVQGLDHLELVIGHFELLAKPLDVAVDGAVIDIDLIIIGSIHQRVAAFHDARALGERLKD